MGEIVSLGKGMVRGHIICRKCDRGFEHEEWQRTPHRVRCPECRSLETSVFEETAEGLFRRVQQPASAAKEG